MNIHRTVLAALDDSDAARAVAHVAQQLVSLLDCPVEAIHVREDGGQTATASGTYAGLKVSSIDGDVVETLATHAGPDTLLVLGSSDRPRVDDPVGHVARELMTRLADPLVVVPPGGTMEAQRSTLLVPMDGTSISRRTLETALDAIGPGEFTALHVLDDTRLPPFGDQVHLEAEAWTREFRARHCTDATPIHLEIRVGAPPEQILRVADEHNVALIVVGWSRHLEPGRARTLRELLLHSTRPLLLLPVAEATDHGTESVPG